MQFKSAFLIATVFITSACTNSSFCDCMSAGEELNDQSNKILNGDDSEDAYVMQQELLEKKRNACQEFENTDGETLKKLQEDCSSD